jgi:DNA excision repair protein ERCC-3
VGEYSGDRREVRPVTVATYQILTRKQGGGFPHFEKLGLHAFGLVIYDEVHLLPAPVFRLTAEIQAKRRLGLTATLIREDGLEGEVFSLIGPKRFDVPWKEIEAQGFIAEATCYELRIPLPPERRGAYDAAEAHAQHHLAATNPAKLDHAARLCADHRDAATLVIGVYLDQLAAAAARLGAPLITGETPQRERERLLASFRKGEIPVLVLSRVGNFSIDLPDASVCIQLSGTFGSRQEEAQRLGRILRPKRDGKQALFYSLVSRDTVEQRFAMNRQLFLTEQGYRYYIEEIGASAPPAAAPPHEAGAKILLFPTRVAQAEVE